MLTAQGHGGRYACPYCEGVSSLVGGVSRTFCRLKRRFAEFVADGSKIKNAKHHANVINECLLGHNVGLVILAIPPPPLHMLMGGTNAIMNVIIQVKGNNS